MNKLLLLIVLFSGISHGQIINFPDPVLKQRLLQADQWNGIAYTHFQVYTNFSNNSVRIDTNADGEIQVSEAQQIKSLNIGPISTLSDNITNTVGIEYFTNLEVFLCYDNAITTLDVTPLTNLKVLYCYHNPLVSLNITGLNSLSALNCSSTLISTLDIHAYPLLSDVGFGNNPNLTTLILKNGLMNACPTGVGQFGGFSNCPNLTYICTDAMELACITQEAASSIPNCVVDSTCTFALSETEFDPDVSFSLYPNPTDSILHVKSDSDIKSLQLYDVQGRLLQTSTVNGSDVFIDISQKSKGIYLLKVTSDKGVKTAKIIKE